MVLHITEKDTLITNSDTENAGKVSKKANQLLIENLFRGSGVTQISDKVEMSDMVYDYQILDNNSGELVQENKAFTAGKSSTTIVEIVAQKYLANTSMTIESELNQLSGEKLTEIYNAMFGDIAQTFDKHSIYNPDKVKGLVSIEESLQEDKIVEGEITYTNMFKVFSLSGVGARKRPQGFLANVQNINFELFTATSRNHQNGFEIDGSTFFGRTIVDTGAIEGKDVYAYTEGASVVGIYNKGGYELIDLTLDEDKKKLRKRVGAYTFLGFAVIDPKGFAKLKYKQVEDEVSPKGKASK